MGRYDLVIFDLDGTLVDSLEDIGDAVSVTLERFGLPPLTPGTLRRNIGSGVGLLLRTIFEAANDGRIASALAAFNEVYASRSTAKTRLYPGIHDVLDDLGDVTKVILTNKGSQFLDAILTGLDLTRYFSAAFGREAFAETKPSPLPVDAILERFGGSRDRSIIIGDTAIDILAGKTAGVATCGVLYGYGTPDELRLATPDALVSLPGDLLRIL
jgi:phosphoglycolate phosphatase